MKQVIVTGGSRGIGAGIVRRFLEEGWRVFATYGSDAAAAEAFKASLGAGADRLTMMRCDLRDETEIKGLFAELDGESVTPDALVNNAGITGARTRLEDAPTKTIREVFAVNAIGTILMCREAVRRMSSKRGGRGGAIVNLSSTGTRLGNPNQWVHYAASKGAIDVFTGGLARELAEEGVRVNAVSPGLTLTDASQEKQILERLAGMRHEIPMNRPGTVEEVAAAVYWLCSEEAAYVTGTVLPVAGGR